jgi:hypothetical protein
MIRCAVSQPVYQPGCVPLKQQQKMLTTQADLLLPAERLLLHLAVVLPLSASSHHLSVPVVRLLVVCPLPAVAVVLGGAHRLTDPTAHGTQHRRLADDDAPQAGAGL